MDNMETKTLTLTEFLLARIAEDEAEVQEVIPPPHVLYDYEVKWQPRRILAECDAKRRIVEEHAELTWYNVQPGGGWRNTGKCRTCAENEEADYDGTPQVEWPCPTLRALAAVYADHDDYRDEWAV